LFETTESYAQAVQEIGDEEDIAVVDAWTLLWDAAGKDEASLDRYLTDGLHLSLAGNEIIYRQLMETIRQRHPEVYHENLRTRFPGWADINWDNPSESLYLERIDTNN